MKTARERLAKLRPGTRIRVFTIQRSYSGLYDAVIGDTLVLRPLTGESEERIPVAAISEFSLAGPRRERWLTVGRVFRALLTAALLGFTAYAISALGGYEPGRPTVIAASLGFVGGLLTSRAGLERPHELAGAYILGGPFGVFVLAIWRRIRHRL